MREAVIVSGARTAVGRAPRGTLRASRPDDMAAAAIGEAVRRAEGLEKRRCGGRHNRVCDALRGRGGTTSPGCPRC